MRTDDLLILAIDIYHKCFARIDLSWDNDGVQRLRRHATCAAASFDTWGLNDHGGRNWGSLIYMARSRPLSISVGFVAASDTTTNHSHYYQRADNNNPNGHGCALEVIKIATLKNRCCSVQIVIS
mmetsp:Transcript_18821/g.21237  ORF Transcript_18821/g.21237 Transcript_18821/m.21237 type:complete len:125 (-) Transcript_18821:420-794(-)